MMDVAVAYNRFQFLGEEFLTWLWFVIATDPKLAVQYDPDFVGLEVGNRMVLENKRHETTERVTIKGDDARLEEGIMALRKGAMVSEINLVYRQADLKWQFTVKGESLNISALNIPHSGLPESDEDLEGVVLERADLYERAIQLVENLFRHFIKLRIATAWQKNTRAAIRKWILSNESIGLR